MPKQKQAQKILKVFLPLLALAFTAQACNFLGGGGRQEPVELTWWKVFDDDRAVRPLVEEFQKAFPHIRINYVTKRVETYEDELVDALAAGRGPDILTIHNDWLPKHKDKLAPMPAGMMSLREFGETFAPVASADLTDDGQIYAIPLAIDVLALFYNKDILASAGIARPPATWEELVRFVPRLARQDSFGDFTRSAVALGTAQNVNRAPDILGLLMLQNGTTFYDENKSRSLLAEQVRDQQSGGFLPASRALEFYTQFANAGKTVYTWNSRSNNSIEAFSAGRAAMIFSYAYLRPALAQRAPFLNYGIAPVPQIDLAGSRINFANYWAEAVSKQSPHAREAWQFLQFISRRDMLAKYYEVQKQPSSRLDILEEQLSDPEIGVFAEGALSARGIYKPDSDAVEAIFVQMIENVVLRNQQPDDAVQDAAQKIDLLLRNF